jgi:hypothetical protein
LLRNSRLSFNFKKTFSCRLCSNCRACQLTQAESYLPSSNYLSYFSLSDRHTGKKRKQKFFLLNKEIQTRSGAKSNMRKGFIIYEEIHKYFTIYEEDFASDPSEFPYK